MKKKEKKSVSYIAFLLLLLPAFACSSLTTLPLAEPPVEAIQTAAESTYEVVEVTADVVNIRYLSGEATGEYALKGDKLYGRIEGDWFILTTMGVEWGKVFLGCVDVETEKGCEAAK